MNHRDKNEPELIRDARRIGWFLVPLQTPVDWIGWFNNAWHVVEIKSPKGKYTPAQQKFLDDCAHVGAPVLTWRTLADVIEASQVKLIGADER